MLVTRRCTMASLTAILALFGATEAIAEHLCRPVLTLDDVEFSSMIPPTLERVWSAVVSVDASQCAANSKGNFDIVFTRLSENAPDLEMREQFTWSVHSLGVSLAFAADEAVAQYRIEHVTPCVCRN
jgi:hypothetical protein